MEYMRDAGLNPEQILVSATGEAASCLCLPEVGTLEKDKWADFLVLGSDPLADIRHFRDIESVWIGGSPVVFEE
jgi:imidazolonepropionase-like amidohydrolase